MLRRGEVLEVVPGLIVTQHAGGGKANQYFLRGFNLDHGTDFAISLDGMPVNMRTHAHGQGYADLNSSSPNWSSALDYDKGTYTAAERRPLQRGQRGLPTARRAAAQGFATFELGENNYYRGALGDTVWLGEGEKALRLTPRRANTTTTTGRGRCRSISTRWNGFPRYFAGDADDHFSVTLHGLPRRAGRAPTRFRSAPSTAG